MYAGVQGEGGQAAGGIAFLVFVGDERDLRGGEGSGDSAGITAALARPVGRDGRGGDEAVGRGRDGGAEEAAGRERGIASGERDFDDGVGFFFRGRARPDTALMAAYIDEHESRFKVGPICGVLSESLDCGFLTPRGCRMLETRPVSRMRAGHEAPARDSSRSARISSWPCTVTGRCTRSWSPRAGIRPRSAATG